MPTKIRLIISIPHQLIHYQEKELVPQNLPSTPPIQKTLVQQPLLVHQQVVLVPHLVLRHPHLPQQVQALLLLLPVVVQQLNLKWRYL